MTRSTAGPARLPDGLGLLAEIDGTQSLTGLTDTVNATCDAVEDRSERAVVVLRFAATASDSRAWPGQVSIREVNRWERAVRRLERLPAMTIALAEGACGGPALDLLLATDFRIAARGLLLMLPVNDGHIWPGMALHRLVHQLGAGRARQIVLWGNDISLDTALDLGLIDQASDDLTEALHTATVLMGRISDPELAVRRQLVLESSTADYDDALGIHLAACDRELRRLSAAPGPARPSGSDPVPPTGQVSA
ncbi:enoyl-CoA hydratase/isomerase family protein [Streptomyces luomodiensis]|uniref:Enoyl-CoA hydratase/isomerase family protein n=1 Tax=Streptomyces luomodiensis TaxID=3026192 RepID=A0ABY9VE96_9ACTN|nr:enoyl-CoA-hydratase DpgB [Streptomyces sp. SCA4-21]WNF01036.1 enoyl-CoA hydratase/isomerase family protein [Streptomyces sp. SCA4-21]